MASLYVLKYLDGKVASSTGYDNRKAAKVGRDQLKKDGTTCVVSRGPDHLRGPTRPDPRCLMSRKPAENDFANVPMTDNRSASI